jgi:hypothetical protein
MAPDDTSGAGSHTIFLLPVANRRDESRSIWQCSVASEIEER